MTNSERDPKPMTQQKALAVNLDDTRFGTIVEIGAGQEVARQFFSAGGAAGTVAKTMSAYDMQFSDEIYGKAGRYVSRERVEQMLDKEYRLVCSRLNKSRGDDTTFFTYATTVTAKSYNSDTPCHGYIGLRFQQQPNAPHSDIFLHVRMMDDDNQSQAEALGVLGVNLIYGVFHTLDNLKHFIESFLDNLDSDRLEIDFIEFSGHGFEHVENRLMNLHLIRSWCTRAVMFDANGRSKIPGDVLRQNPIMIIRGSFKPPTKVHTDMFESGRNEFAARPEINRDNIVSLAEITMTELGGESEDADEDFLMRVDLLNSLGYNVLISDYLRFFRLRSWLRRYTHEPIGFILSVLDFDSLFNPRFYDGLEGGILEAMGKLFPDNTHVFVYPRIKNDELITLDNVEIEPEQKHLLQYLIENGLLLSCPVVNEDNLHISVRRTLDMIAANKKGWKDAVAPEIAEQIVSRELLGYREG